MPPRRPTRPTPPEVDHLRAALGQGKLVRVGIAPSDQFPDGVTGRVRRMGDPAVDGDEFIFVEVPIGGAKDVLPFAAADLIGAPARGRPVAGAAPKPAPGAGPKQTAPQPPTATRAATTPKPQPTATTPRPTAADRTTPVPAPNVSPASGVPAKPPAPARGRRAPVSITIST